MPEETPASLPSSLCVNPASWRSSRRWDSRVLLWLSLRSSFRRARFNAFLLAPSLAFLEEITHNGVEATALYC